MESVYGCGEVWGWVGEVSARGRVVVIVINEGMLREGREGATQRGLNQE